MKILYEDKDILAIDKPAGIAVHPDGRSKEKTITDWAVKKYPGMKNVGEMEGEVFRPGVVHRLDRDTSGALLLAKTKEGHAYLKKQFQNREVKKVYYALVDGTVKNDRGVVNKSIGRSPTDFRKWLAGRGARGELRDAVTQWHVIKRLKDKNGHKFTYLEVRPKTGRTHQIRVHMKYMNHPVVGDTLYNPDGKMPKGIKRMMLHAGMLEFENLKGEKIKIASPLPKEFDKMLK